MPAEWEPHEATWLSWPHRDGISFPDAYDRVVPTFVKMVEALATSETVRINVDDAEHEKEVRKLIGSAGNGSVEFYHIPTNEPWCRDHGPVFVRNPETGELRVIDFEYNAWGWKYPPFDEDDQVPKGVAEKLGLPVVDCPMILEGGSIDVNGAGDLLTTESCLLNPNRNPEMNRAEIEAMLKGYLGVSNIIWLGDGIEGDDTDGHIDDLTRFVNEDTVVTVVEEDESDANFEPLQANLSKLQTTQLGPERPLEVKVLPMPSKLCRDGQRLPASYANFYIANKVVLLPVFNDRNDAWAVSVMKECFPDREIVAIDCREVVWGLGAFHCLTQQQPAKGSSS